MSQRLDKLRSLTSNAFSLRAETSSEAVMRDCQSFCLRFLSTKESSYA
ncbi:shikimate kinase [Chlamydia trachomatis L2c]|nr:shikimate kinase [Chlamydia trachomatis L2c]